MKAIFKLSILLVSISTSFGQESDQSNINQSNINYPLLQGPYLGQEPPGEVAEPFAPGIISKEGWEIEGVFAPGMKEFYYTTRSGKGAPITVIGFRQEGNVWKKYMEFKRKGEISFSPDGSRMHMAEGYKDRIGEGWSERKSLGSMFDREDWGIMRLTSSAKGTYVFDDYKSGDVIRLSRLEDGKRQAPEALGAVVNTGEWTAHPFIAPDESYLIWDSEREGGFGDSDLYISFRQEDGSWGSAINMGNKINSDKWDAYASVTSDGKYMLFNRRIDDGSDNENMDVDIYWVDAKIIEDLKLKYENRYLGQKPPGLVPEVFAPGIVSIDGRYEGAISFSPDLEELYFGANNDGEETAIYFSKLQGGKWTPIKKANFTRGNKKEELHPYVSPVDQRIYFTAFDSIFSDERIWYVNRLEDSWGNAVLLDSRLNDDMAFFPNQSKNGDLYYFNLDKMKTYYAPHGGGEFPNVQEVDIAFGHHAFISPSQDYLVMTARTKEEGRTDNDVFVCFKESNGSWTDPINLGSAVNSGLNEKTPSIFPDGKYLFFGRAEREGKVGLSNIHWVSTEIIEQVRPEDQ